MGKAYNQDKNRWEGRQLPVICVTGPMAAGKHLASDILASKGWASVDADKVAHKALDLLKDEIVALHSEKAQKLGIQLVNQDGSLNRRGIGILVFDDELALQRHEALVHPMVERLLEDFVAEHPEEPVVINATVLYKSHILNKCDAFLFIDAPMILRFFRARNRDHMAA